MDDASLREHVIEVREPGRVSLRLLVRGTLPLGRHCTGLLLGDERVSRCHCELSVDPVGRLLVEDSGSSNGTFVNGSEISAPTELRPGDEITIGDTTIAVDADLPEDVPVNSTGSVPSATVVGKHVTSPPIEASMVGGTRTMVFSDIVDSTSQNALSGDRAWLDLLRLHDEVIRDQLERNGGTEIKAQGDGFFMTFVSARRGLLFAVGAQQALAELRRTNPDFNLHVRIGVNTGEVLVDEGDLFGRHVNLAARVAAAAGTDEIAASSLVQQLAAPMGDFTFGQPRTVTLKGFDEPQLIHPVVWD